tara:strand:- start:256 stop:537 length:282 start_codon:yes stop_codon:yes gene_type:complete
LTSLFLFGIVADGGGGDPIFIHLLHTNVLGANLGQTTHGARKHEAELALNSKCAHGEVQEMRTTSEEEGRTKTLTNKNTTMSPARKHNVFCIC